MMQIFDNLQIVNPTDPKDYPPDFQLMLADILNTYDLETLETFKTNEDTGRKIRKKYEYKDRTTEFPCPSCYRVFYNRGNLKVHMLTHKTGKKSRRIECDICHREFHAKYRYKLHLRSHHSEEARSSTTSNSVSSENDIDHRNLVTSPESQSSSSDMENQETHCNSISNAVFSQMPTPSPQPENISADIWNGLNTDYSSNYGRFNFPIDSPTASPWHYYPPEWDKPLHSKAVKTADSVCSDNEKKSRELMKVQPKTVPIVQVVKQNTSYENQQGINGMYNRNYVPDILESKNERKFEIERPKPLRINDIQTPQYYFDPSWSLKNGFGNRTEVNHYSNMFDVKNPLVQGYGTLPPMGLENQKYNPYTPPIWGYTNYFS